MSARYIVRLDDACETMDKKKWEMIEKILNNYNIMPIVAVVPNNKDNNLKLDEFDKIFWEKVKNWDDNGWHIALHGYDHQYVTDDGGLVPINNRSEFAGLSYEVQQKKIKQGFNVFKEKEINCKIWVAPGHSFDENTIKALLNVTDIKIISDGIAFEQYYDFSMYWLPQQLWRARKMPFGTWTICLHPSTMTQKQFDDLENFLLKYSHLFQDISSFNLKKRKKNILEKIFENFYWLLLGAKR